MMMGCGMLDQPRQGEEHHNQQHGCTNHEVERRVLTQPDSLKPLARPAIHAPRGARPRRERHDVDDATVARARETVILPSISSRRVIVLATRCLQHEVSTLEQPPLDRRLPLTVEMEPLDIRRPSRPAPFHPAESWDACERGDDFSGQSDAGRNLRRNAVQRPGTGCEPYPVARASRHTAEAVARPLRVAAAGNVREIAAGHRSAGDHSRRRRGGRSHSVRSAVSGSTRVARRAGT